MNRAEWKAQAAQRKARRLSDARYTAQRKKENREATANLKAAYAALVKLGARDKEIDKAIDNIGARIMRRQTKGAR